MTVYLGDSGGLSLRRWTDGDDPLAVTLEPDDVNTVVDRFSVDWRTPSGPQSVNELCPFVTGDHIRIQSPVTTTDVVLITGNKNPVVEAYVSVDQAGTLALYADFDDAINNNKAARLALEKHTAAQSLLIQPIEGSERCLARVVSYEFTTERETIDVTSLGDEFRERFTRGLISGQGTLQCYWEFQDEMCGDFEDVAQTPEFSNYLLHLAQRVTYGADFLGVFYLNKTTQRSVWQEAECIVTGATFQVSAGQPIASQINFVSTGPFELRVGVPEFELLMESGDAILKEKDGEILIEQTDE